MRFHEVEHAYAIVKSRTGVFREAKLFRAGQRLFVNLVRSGYVRLETRDRDQGGWRTSAKNVTVLEVSATKPGALDDIGHDQLGRPMFIRGEFPRESGVTLG